MYTCPKEKDVTMKIHLPEVTSYFKVAPNKAAFKFVQAVNHKLLK
jgi:hypothetical protein